VKKDVTAKAQRQRKDAEEKPTKNLASLFVTFAVASFAFPGTPPARARRGAGGGEAR
jgi:hypothetical protein